MSKILLLALMLLASMISIDEAAEQLSVSRRTIRRLISKGDLVAYRVGTDLIRIKPEDLAQLLKRRRVAPEVD
jgi:excisionase family DNA binding protein